MGNSPKLHIHVRLLVARRLVTAMGLKCVVLEGISLLVDQCDEAGIGVC